MDECFQKNNNQMNEDFRVLMAIYGLETFRDFLRLEVVTSQRGGFRVKEVGDLGELLWLWQWLQG